MYIQRYFPTLIIRYWLTITIVFFIPNITSGQDITQPSKTHSEYVALPEIKIYDTVQLLALLKQYQPGADSTGTHNEYVLQTLLQYSRDINFPLGAARALNSLGHIYWNRNKYNDAIQSFSRSAQYGTQVKDIRGKNIVCQAYNNLGNIYQYQGDFSRAAAYYFKAVNIIEDYPQAFPRAQLIYNNLGNSEQHADRALYYLNKADSLSRRENDLEILNFVLLNKVAVYEKTKQWEMALTAAREANRISLGSGDPLMQYRALFSFAGIYNAMNQPREAQRYIEQAEKLHPEGDKEIYQEAINNYVAGSVSMKLKRYKQSEYYLRKAIENGEKVKAAKYISEAYNSMAILHATQGQYENAFRYQQDYIALRDSLMNETIAERISSLDIKFRTAQKDRELIQKKLLISDQKQQILKKNVIIAGIGIGTVIIMLLLGILFLGNRRKQKLLQQQHEISQLKAIMKGEEKERGRLARELHDGIGGMLAAIKMNIGSAIKENPEAAEQLNLPYIEQLLTETSGEVRKTAHNLMPDVLSKYGLAEAVSMYCKQVNSANKLRIDLQFHSDLSDLDKSIELILYRIVQELLQNVIKHAEASHVAIQVIRHGDNLHLSVEDNGKGFDPLNNTNGAGLANLRYRIQALQGVIAILSAEGQPTTVHIEFDINQLKNAINQ